MSKRDHPMCRRILSCTSGRSSGTTMPRKEFPVSSRNSSMKRDHPMIEQILTLIDLFQNHLAASGQLGDPPHGAVPPDGPVLHVIQVKTARSDLYLVKLGKIWTGGW